MKTKVKKITNSFAVLPGNSVICTNGAFQENLLGGGWCFSSRSSHFISVQLVSNLESKNVCEKILSISRIHSIDMTLLIQMILVCWKSVITLAFVLGHEWENLGGEEEEVEVEE